MKLTTLVRGNFGLRLEFEFSDPTFADGTSRASVFSADIMAYHFVSICPKRPRKNEELLRRWRVVGAAGTEVDITELNVLGKKGAEAAMKTLKFVKENVVADTVPPPQVQNDCKNIEDKEPHPVKHYGYGNK